MRFKTAKNLLMSFVNDKSRRIFLIFLLAFVIRLAALYMLIDNPRGDAADYENIALNIIKGKGFVSTRMGLYSYRPPLYPLFLACIFSIFRHSYLIVGFFQAIIASITCVAVFYIGEYIFDEKTGLISSVIMALYPSLVFYSTQLLSETLFILILCLFIYVFYNVRNGVKTKLKWPLLGILLGLGSLCRPVIFPFLFFLIPFCFFSLKLNLRKWILVMSFSLLTIAPWTIRNYHVHREFVLLTTYGGANLWMGNYPGARGHIGDPGNINRLVRERGVPETKKDLFFCKKGLSFITGTPLDFIILSLKKLVLFWNPLVEKHIGPSYIRDNSIDYKTIITISFSCLIVFTMIGFFSISGLWRKTGLLLILIMYFSMVSMIFYVSLRYRQPIIPVLSIFAGKGMRFSFSLFKEKTRRLIPGERLIGVSHQK
jgi:4-amino-4-deoxy-L-arabinose transferase-like glycosyltransferase